MRLNDVFTEELTEAPAGVFKQLGTAVRAMNPFSMSGQARARGEANTQQLANQLYSAYHTWAGERGIAMDTQNTVKEFLKQQGYNPQVIKGALSKLGGTPGTATGAPVRVDKTAMDQAFLAAAQAAGQPNSPRTSRSSSTSAQASPGSTTSTLSPNIPGPTPNPTTPSPAPTTAPSPTPTPAPTTAPTPTPAPTTAPTPTPAPTTAPSPTPTPTTAPSGRPTTTKNDVVQYYMTLSAVDRQALIQELKKIPLTNPTSTSSSVPVISPTRKRRVKTATPEGYSNFLGRDL